MMCFRLVGKLKSIIVWSEKEVSFSSKSKKPQKTCLVHTCNLSYLECIRRITKV
jgi:hypothetical protein